MFWTRLIENFLLPPAGLIWLGLAGLVLAATRHRRWGLGLLAASVVASFLLATPLAGGMLLATLDRYPPLPADGPLVAAECIVVLGAGQRSGAREHGGDTVSTLGLERLRYGAWLAERSALPILVTGPSGAEMARTLERSFHAGVRWIEAEGRNTHENAVFSARLLRPEAIRRLYLVTHFWHMPRAVAAFRRAGLEPLPAPLGFAERRPGERGILAVLPRAWPLVACREVLHEWIGRAWYRLRYGY